MKPLLPDRHPNEDFFVCDVLDAVPKDDMASMAHPVFSLSTKPDTNIRKYEHNGNTVEVAPSVRGLATVHDKDILIYCISQLIAKINQGEHPDRTVRLKAHDLLVATNRETSGDGYRRLKDAFERLAGTRITTDICTHGEQIISGFGLLDSWEIRIKDPQTKRMIELEVTLSKWMYNSVLGREVLTLSRDYFRLRKPLERRVYEIARKHCGHKIEWSISLDLLQKKCGSKGDIREFRRMIRRLTEHDHLPDYRVTLADDCVTFFNRQTVTVPTDTAKETAAGEAVMPLLQPETYARARHAAPGCDVYGLEHDWQHFWVESGRPALRDADAAFIAFCQQRYQRQARC